MQLLILWGTVWVVLTVHLMFKGGHCRTGALLVLYASLLGSSAAYIYHLLLVLVYLCEGTAKEECTEETLQFELFLLCASLTSNV